MKAPRLLFFVVSLFSLPTSSCAYCWSQQQSRHFFQRHPLPHSSSSSMTLFLQSRGLHRAANRMAQHMLYPQKTIFSQPTQTQTTFNASSRRGSPALLGRLLGSKADIPGNPPGNIVVENCQDDLPSIDLERLRSTIDQIRSLIGYPTYDVALILVEDDFMQETNLETRGMDKPTDILSFQFTPHEPDQAGVLQEPEFDIPDFYNLGEMLVDVPYVMRQCREDEDYFASHGTDDENDDKEEEDRGVSGAMAKIYNPEERINMLLVHGMLHLVGHDHEEDDEYELMVSKEEEILEKLGMMPSK